MWAGLGGDSSSSLHAENHVKAGSHVWGLMAAVVWDLSWSCQLKHLDMTVHMPACFLAVQCLGSKSEQEREEVEVASFLPHSPRSRHIITSLWPIPLKKSQGLDSR